MDKSRISGAAQIFKGRIEKIVGKLTGSKSIETNANVDTTKGAVSTAAGKAKDTLRVARSARGI